MNKGRFIWVCLLFCFCNHVRAQDVDTLSGRWVFSEIDSVALNLKYPGYYNYNLIEEEKEIVMRLVLDSERLKPYRISLETHYFQVVPMCSLKNDTMCIVVNGFCLYPEDTNLMEELMSIRGFPDGCYITFEVDLVNNELSPIVFGM